AIDDVPDWNIAKGSLREIRTAALRAKDVVKQILSFSRPSMIEKKQIRVTPIVGDTVKLLRASVPSTIDIQQDIACETDTIVGDPTQINQVLINLCTNASHALPETGGVLKVQVKEKQIDADAASRYLDLSPGRYLEISVSDNGHGIDPGIMNQIFDPFFTTKEVGKGEGLGLSVVQGIVKGHAGEIIVDSQPAKGTTFRVYLPLNEEDLVAEPIEDDILPKGTEQILFIDDEVALARAYSIIIKSLGYSVISCANPVEALEMVRDRPDKFDLVITDMTMPQMTGDRLAKKLMQIRFGLPVILCTGYHQRISENEAIEMGISAFLMKPLIKKDLAKTIRKVLDAGRSVA
ncbi:MAG: response regulator, partial [Deltaproteobacteria bacterium]|nr:response regulator [Deltaproteobacteria bacterium]